jgi:hypothetical protein
MIQKLGKGSAMSKDGFDNELSILAAINGKTYRDLNANLQKMIKVIFPEVQDNDLLECGKKGGNDKADIEVTLGKSVARVSIKKGTGNSVHQEPVENFIDYLSANFGDNPAVFDAIRHFVWGDGSLDGTGPKASRLSSSEYSTAFPNNLSLIRNYFSSIKKELIVRFVLVGDKGLNVPDFVYYGDVSKGSCVSASNVVNFLIKKIKLGKSSVPIGGLTFQAWNRAIKPGSSSEKKRGQIQLKWSDIEKDLRKISNE